MGLLEGHGSHGEEQRTSCLLSRQLYVQNPGECWAQLSCGGVESHTQLWLGLLVLVAIFACLGVQREQSKLKVEMEGANSEMISLVKTVVAVLVKLPK